MIVGRRGKCLKRRSRLFGSQLSDAKKRHTGSKIMIVNTL